MTVGATTTRYALDVAGGLPEVIAATGGASTQYLQVQGQILAQYDSGTWGYVAPDALGSVRQVVDPAGAVTLAQSYDPFGDLLSSAGSGNSGFGYTGEQTDASTGLVYLRARYYQPGTGRFLTQDSAALDILTPSSLNGWVYVTNNPINSLDPTGLREWQKSSSKFERIAERVYATSRPDIQFIHLEPSIPVPWGRLARPDVVNSWEGEVYEVEPLHLLMDGFAEAIYYRDLLTWAGKGGINLRGQTVAGHWALPRADPNDWNLTTWQLGAPFPPIRKTPGLIQTAYGPEIIPPGFDFVVMSPGGGAMVWWLEPRPETVAVACFVTAAGIVAANTVEDILTGGTGLVDEPVAILFAGTLIVIGKSELDKVNSPIFHIEIGP